MRTEVRVHPQPSLRKTEPVALVALSELVSQTGERHLGRSLRKIEIREP